MSRSFRVAAGTGSRGWSTALVWLATAAALGGLTACSTGDDDGARPKGRSRTEAEDVRTTSTFASVHDEIAARYKAFWEARFEANSPPNPDDPALREYATGEQLDQVLQETQEHQRDGVEFRRPETPANYQRVDVVWVTGDTAVIQECVVSDGVVFYSSTGEVIDDRVTTYNMQAEMRFVDGEWRVAHTTAVQQWEGVAGCALAG
jgi:hypothetical protein